MVTNPIFLSKRIILGFHRALLAEFGGDYLHATVYAQAAAYLFHLVQNHPFVDGNKRVAYAAMRVFLEVNGYRLELTQEEKYQFVMAAAEGKLNKEDIALRLKEVTVAV